MPEFVHDVDGVETGVIGDGLRDDFEGLRETVNDQLLFAGDLL